MREAVLVRARPLSPSVRELTFDPGPDHQFVPGHWVTFFRDRVGEEPIKRQYSVASAPRADGTFDLAVTRVEGGPMSTFLHEAEPGARVRMLEAQGMFVLAEPARPILMVATGTGIAPFRAMLQHLAVRAETDVTLLFGHRTTDDLLYDDELRALAARWPRFRFEPTLSRAGDAWNGRRGYVQAHLPEIVSRIGTNLDVYVCGLTKMVKDVRRICREELGVDRKAVHIERYD
jgi:CDP-4-dehydro-6-deoxyglucose reductase, E3